MTGKPGQQRGLVPLLTIATLYGFLNAFDVAPRVDAWAAFPLWAVGLAIGRLFQRDGGC